MIRKIGGIRSGRRLVLRLAFVAAGLAFVVRALFSGWKDGSFDHLQPAWLVAALVASIATMTFVAARWSASGKVVGARLPVADAVPMYFQGEVGKYLPGAVWAVVGRAELARRFGVARSAAYASVGMSLAGMYLAGALAAVLLLPFAAGARGAGAVIGVVAFLVVGLLGLHPAVVAFAVRVVERVARRSLHVSVPRWRDSISLVVGYLPAWGLVAVANWCALRSLGVSAPISHVGFASSVSWCAGFLAIPAPGGIGVRESVFVLTSGISSHDAAAGALLARFAFVLTDGVGALAGAAWMTRRTHG